MHKKTDWSCFACILFHLHSIGSILCFSFFFNVFSKSQIYIYTFFFSIYQDTVIVYPVCATSVLFDFLLHQHTYCLAFSLFPPNTKDTNKNTKKCSNWHLWHTAQCVTGGENMTSSQRQQTKYFHDNSLNSPQTMVNLPARRGMLSGPPCETLSRGTGLAITYFFSADDLKWFTVIWGSVVRVTVWLCWRGPGWNWRRRNLTTCLYRWSRPHVVPIM